MSASGKSGNRLHEYYRGYFEGPLTTCNGPAALAGQQDRAREDERRKAENDQDRMAKRS